MMSSTVAETEEAAVAAAETLDKSQKRMWMKYYCDVCEAWETRELFETNVDASSSLHRGGQSGNGGNAENGGKDDALLLYSWGCAKVIHYGSFQTLRVDQLNSADGRDAPQDARFPDEVAAAFPSLSSQPADQPVRSRMMTRAKADSTQQLLLQAAQSNGSLQSKSQSKRSRKQAHPTSAHTSKVEAASPNSQGGVTSSSHPAENVTTSKRQVGNNNAFDETEAAGTESPAVIDAERLGNGPLKRPRRLTAGDRGFAQALEYEKESRTPTTTPKPVAKDNSSVVKPEAKTSSPAAMKRPKRVTAGLRGLVLAAENAHFSPRGTATEPKKEQNVDRQQVGVGTRSSQKKLIPKSSKKNRRLGDLY